MTFLPIVGRELRAASRRNGTYWGRLLVALAACGIGGIILYEGRYSPPFDVGRELFTGLTVVISIYVILVGIGVTADALSAEKREGTLGLLFLTDLKGYDVVLGKLAATSMSAAYGLLAVFPVLAVSLLLGGVTHAEYWRIFLALANTMFVSLCAGMLTSSLCESDRRSMFLSFLILAALSVGTLVLGEWLSSRYEHWWFVFSPAYSAAIAFESEFAKHPERYWTSVGILHGLGWLFLLMSGVIVKRSWQDRPVTVQSRGVGEAWRRWGLRGERARRRLRGLWLGANPWFWLQVRDRRRMVFLWGVRGVAWLCWLLGGLRWPRDWLDPVMYFFTAFTLHTILKFRMAMEASQRLLADRQSGAMELLLSTPMSERDLIQGQFMALRHQFLWPVTVVLLMDFLFLLSDVRDDEWVWTCVCGVMVLVADLIALAWLGMWMGMVHRRTVRAAGSALAKILALPWLIFFGLILFFELSNVRVGNDGFVFILWLGIALGVDGFFIARARQALLSRFREMAANRFGGRTRPVPAAGRHPGVRMAAPETGS